MKKTKPDTTAIDHPFKTVRRAAVPLVAWETADPRATMVACQKADNGRESPFLQWDCVSGLRGANKAGVPIAKEIGEPAETQNLVSCLELVATKYKAPQAEDKAGAVFFIHNGHNAFQDPSAIQAIWNLRDKFKSDAATLLLMAPAFTVPAELKHDVIVISEELPGEAELAGIADNMAEESKLPNLDETAKEKVVDTLRGLSAFAAEQVFAMSVKKNGEGKRTLDAISLWERKRKMIEQTPGLSVWRGGETFKDIGGCDSIKAYLKDYMQGPAKMRAVVWIDEIEKALAGSGGGDLSGVSSDYLGQLLTYMQDSGARGLIFVGPPGAAKSAIAKATGNEGNVPTIALDLGGMKGSLVGQSEQQLRGALKVITAVSDGNALWIATCNSLAALPPELKRRFALGTWFFDLPTYAERKVIFDIYAAKYPDVKKDCGVDELNGWTGAEIKALFDTSWATNRTLSRASKIIVPVCKSAADRIEALRTAASGKFTNAGAEGIYDKVAQEQTSSGRKIID